MKEEKMYFPEWSDYCYTLPELMKEAKAYNISEFYAFEAVPDRTQKQFWFCEVDRDIVERDECNKPNCNDYEPNKSGRGVCCHRRHCWAHGNKIHFKTE